MRHSHSARLALVHSSRRGNKSVSTFFPDDAANSRATSSAGAQSLNHTPTHTKNVSSTKWLSFGVGGFKFKRVTMHHHHYKERLVDDYIYAEKADDDNDDDYACQKERKNQREKKKRGLRHPFFWEGSLALVYVTFITSTPSPRLGGTG